MHPGQRRYMPVTKHNNLIYHGIYMYVHACMYVCVYVLYTHTHTHTHRGCFMGNGQDIGRMFFRLSYIEMLQKPISKAEWLQK